MGYKDFIKNQFPGAYKTDGEVFNVLIGAIGAAIDAFDPIALNLASEFSVTASSGSALTLNGNDWGIPRRNAEVDSSLKARILAALPLYALGPTNSGMSAVVASFTGAAPTIFAYGPSSFIMGESAIGDAGFSSIADVFTFELHINNPNSLSYNHLDLETAVNKAKLARDTAIIYHNGIDTSTAGQSATAVSTII